MFEQVLLYAQTNVQLAPLIIGGLLLLAGFNIPISEDLMLFISAILAAKNPEYLIHLYIGVFLGAYLSDIIAYAFMGRFLGQKLYKIKQFKKMVTPNRVEKVLSFYERYGILTLLVGRFIPFGIRNALFISAGFSKMNSVKFCISDFFATVLSTATYFYIYFIFGEMAIEWIKRSNVIIFSIFATIVIILLFNRQIKKRRTKSSPQ